MRFCLQLSHQSWSSGDSRKRVERTFELIRSADRAGFDSVWITEDPDGWDAFAILGAAARETSQVRLGSGVTNPYMRHPNLIAASISTLDRLSGGRSFLGLGRGQPEWYRTSLGIQVDSPLRAVESTLRLLRQWWNSPFVASGSDPFPVNRWERSIAPAGPTLPPVYIAATGPKMLRLAGRLADGVRFNEMASANYLKNAISLVKNAAAESGRNPADLSFFVQPGISVTDHPAEVLERKKATLAMIHALPGMERQLESPGIDVQSIMGDVRRHMRTNEILARGGGFPELRRGGDLESAKKAIPIELMTEVAIVGSVTHVRSRLYELSQLGVTHVFVNIDELSPDVEAIKQLLAEILLVSS